ncbi:hypothetical protein EUX98_g2364 [Antrodiella citrinella]|uniref:Uncharacterized protein n=1 Tax=Antrodiella citrinella TaxID=2447956 RepID=A0A4S4MZ67_9APHY|nr:hypothetical protein EUX98_g2364 [Antrodiella citrinella]
MNTTPTPTTETAISMASSVASLSAISSGPQEPSATPTQRLMESGGDATDVSFTSTPATPSGYSCEYLGLGFDFIFGFFGYYPISFNCDAFSLSYLDTPVCSNFHRDTDTICESQFNTCSILSTLNYHLGCGDFVCSSRHFVADYDWASIIEGPGTNKCSSCSIPSQTVQVPTSETTGPARTLTINGPIAGLTSTPAANTLPAPGETGVSQPGASDALNASASASKTRKNIAIVAALTGTLGVILIVVLCFFLYRRRQRKGNGAMWQPHVDHRHMSQRPMSAGSDSWVRFQGGSPTGSMIATSEESAVWQSYGPGGSNNLNNIGLYSAGTEVTTPYTEFMMQDNYTTVSLLANASTTSIAPSTAIGRSESQMSSNSPSTWSSAQDDRTHLAAATFLATAPRPLPTALDNRSQQVVSPPMYTGVSTIAEESESALQRSFSPSSQLIAKAVPPTIQVESPGASQEGPSETPPLRGGFELFRRSFQSTLTQASELSELSAYSVSSPAYPGFSRPPLPPLPTNINTTANDGSVSAKPGPKLLIPQPVTSPHRESIVPSPGDNIDMFLDLASPTPEMLRNVGLDESPITANPFRDSTDTTSDYSHSASTPAGRFRWTEKEPLPKY